MNEIRFQPIGFIESKFENPKDLIFACEDGLSTNTVSKILINKAFEKGVAGLDGFSHAFVIYFLNKVNRTELKTHPGPPGVSDLPRVGVFASRSQYRPNPIALRLVELIKIYKNEIYVKGLDAVNNTPVLDVKPYVPGFDRPEKPRVADWYDWLKPV